MKVFISQPMRGRFDLEIEEERRAALEFVHIRYPGKKIEEIESWFVDAPADAKPLELLGESIKMMADADIVVFCPGWADARGCRVEHMAACGYGIEVLEYLPGYDVTVHVDF